MKSCTKCGVHKELKDFRKNKGTKDGHTTRCRSCLSAADKAYKKADPDKYRRSKFKCKYNITDQKYDQLMAVKRCEICGADGPLVVDHCHSTGEVRGMICAHCNSGLGYFLDNPNFLTNAIAYLSDEL